MPAPAPACGVPSTGPRRAAPQLGFSFPYQPNIMESIRNLLWHVPMWFAMFFVMGIGFVASLMQLRTGPHRIGTTAEKPP